MKHEDINNLETRDYIFKIGDRGKGIRARYDENTDALIFPRAAFDYVYGLLKEVLSQEPCDDAHEEEIKKLKEQPTKVYIDKTDYQRGYIDGVNQMVKELMKEERGGG